MFYVHTFEAYIGNDSIWSNNPKCPGGPHLKSDYGDYFDNNAFNYKKKSKSPAYGFEVWCNMSGRYTFFVATGVPTYYISICTVAVFGTSYIRSTDPPSSITLDECPKVLTVDHVRAKHVISDILAINLQQKPGAELSWVSIVNYSSDAVMTIMAKDVPAGVYSLVLESVDKNSSLPTLVLKTDTVTIYKTEFVRSTSISSFLVILKGNSVSLSVEKT